MRYKYFILRVKVENRWVDLEHDNPIKLALLLRKKVKGKKFVIKSLTITFPWKEFNSKK